MKKHWGIGGIILGLLFLSAELYCLKVIQSLEMLHGTWLLNAWEYMKEPQCLIAILITIGVIIYSCYLAFFSKKVSAGGYLKRVLYKGIFIEYNKTELINIKTRYFFVKSDVFLWPGLRNQCSCDQIDSLKGLLNFFYVVTPFIECFMHWSLTNYVTYLIITVLYITVIWRETHGREVYRHAGKNPAGCHRGIL